MCVLSSVLLMEMAAREKGRKRGPLTFKIVFRSQLVVAFWRNCRPASLSCLLHLSKLNFEKWYSSPFILSPSFPSFPSFPFFPFTLLPRNYIIFIWRTWQTRVTFRDGWRRKGIARRGEGKREKNVAWEKRRRGRTKREISDSPTFIDVISSRPASYNLGSNHTYSESG